MKLSALALDYDGTIAVDGSMDSAVRQAIGDARRHGIVVILVTGRRTDDLRRVCPDVSCFDVIVGENGAVLEFPASGRREILGHPPPARFLDELWRRGVEFATGSCVVEMSASAAGTVLEALQSLELPLILAFNRGRLMVLPQAIAKSTGLRHALRARRISVHNTVGIGDAENDHDLLDACEVGAAVEWGSSALRAEADEVVQGQGPSAVGRYIRQLMAQPRLSSAQMGRRRMILGHEHTGEPVSLALRGRTIIVAGEPGTGKSWLAGLLCEQLILQGYCLCIIDPEGDYRALEALPDVVRLGGDDPPPTAREVTRALMHPDTSLVIDLARLEQEAKIGYVRSLLPVLIRLRHHTGLPHKIVLDEAHHFLSGTTHAQLIDPALAGYILVTYRVSSLDPDIRNPSSTICLVTRETDEEEIRSLLAMRPAPSGAGADATRHAVARLQLNEGALLPGADEAHGRIRRFTFAPRMTAHVRHRVKYFDVPVSEALAFVFTADGPSTARARTLREFVWLLETSADEVVRAHAIRHDFSRWVADVFRDGPLASRLHGLETACQGDAARATGSAMAQAVRARYDTGGASDQPSPARG